MNNSTKVTRVDARDKVTGAAQYPADIPMENVLYGKVLFSGQPHARMLKMDVEEATAVAGVVAILTAKDVPVNEYGLIMPDQPVMVGFGTEKMGADVSLWEGDHVAVIIAESEEAAAAARDLIKIEWEQLPIVTNTRDAMKDEVILHPWHGSNILHKIQIRKGDVEAGFAAADVIIEGEYDLPYQEHAFLQPEAGVGYIDEDGRVTIEIGGQWTYEDREQVAHALGLDEEKVRIIYPAIGGAFGGREDMSLQIVLGLAAMRLNERGIHRPVRITWSREESMIGHHKRHQATISTKWGATKEGKITAVSAEVIFDSGSYAYTSTKVLGNANLMVTGPYVVPNAFVDSYAVTTNNIPGGAFRGFGGPQGAFAAEMQMNKLAEALAIDPVKLRLNNVLREGDLMTVQTPITPGVTIAEVVEECANVSGWGQPIPPAPDNYTPFQSLPPNPAALKRGRGFACALKNVGFSFGAPEGCDALIELYGTEQIDRAVLYHGSSEVGQGTHTALRQMAAMALNIPLEKVSIVMSDTATSGNSGSVSASRMTFMAGNSIREAAEAALAAWDDGDRPAIGDVRFIPPKTEPYDPETGKCMPNFSYGYVAQAVDVTVDTETGHIQVDRVICANDVGKAINHSLVVGQIEGAVVQAHGYALMENLVVEDGRVQNPYFSQYLIPGIKDIPQRVDSIVMELPDPIGPFGARGMAEMPFLPLAPAIAAAVHDATGVWFDTLPLLPHRVVAGLAS